MEATGKIFQQIPKVMADIEAIAKDRKNEQQGFKFRGIDDVYNEIHSKLAKHGVFTVPTIIGRTRETLEKKSIYQGQEKITRGSHVVNHFRFRFYAEDGSYIEADADGEAIDWGGDKASNKSASIAHKYALLQVFCIPTEDEKDPDGQWNEHTVASTLPRPAPQRSTTFSGITDDQRKLAYALAKQAGLADDDVKSKWKEITGKDSSKEWTRADFDKVLETMKSMKK